MLTFVVAILFYYTVITIDCPTVPAVPLLHATDVHQLAAPHVQPVQPVSVIVGGVPFVTSTTIQPLHPPHPPPPQQFTLGDCAPFHPFHHFDSIVHVPEIHLIAKNIIHQFHPAAPHPQPTVPPPLPAPEAQLPADGNHPYGVVTLIALAGKYSSARSCDRLNLRL